MEPDFYRVAPPEITVHFERIYNGDWGNQPKSFEYAVHHIGISSKEAATVDAALFGFDAGTMNEAVSRGDRSLAKMKSGIGVCACTSGPYHNGYIQFEREMPQGPPWPQKHTARNGTQP
jgi:hypothetical protein